MDGTPLSSARGTHARLEAYLDRPMDPPAPEVAEALAGGAIDPADALPLGEVDRLLYREPLSAETGWCTLADGVGYVAVRTPLPDVTAAMVDWWFDWHPRDSLRYRIWHPAAHHSNRLDPPKKPRAKPFWGAVHHPVEDVGVGVAHARIEFVAPTQIGFSTNELRNPEIGTIVCGFAGDDRTRMRHTPMIHVFMREGDGLVLRSRFWLGAALRPYLPAPLAAPLARALNHRLVRARLPDGLPEALANHCAEEFANLGGLLPELYAAYGPAARG